MTQPSRMTAQIEGEFVVFLIGMRINKWWRPDLWIPVAIAMTRMLRELKAKPDLGLLGVETPGPSNPTLMVQYWRSSEHLLRYATSKDAEHLPAWIAYREKLKTSPGVGVWHETYVVKPGQYENVYVDTPNFGMGRFGTLVPASGARHGAKGRMAATAQPAAEPVPAESAPAESAPAE